MPFGNETFSYHGRTWKLRNKVKIMRGGMQSAVKLAAVQESKLHNIDNVEMGNVEMDSIDMNENETKKTKEEKLTTDWLD